MYGVRGGVFGKKPFTLMTNKGGFVSMPRQPEVMYYFTPIIGLNDRLTGMRQRDAFLCNVAG